MPFEIPGGITQIETIAVGKGIRPTRRRHGRIIDESGEDYLYPAERFAPVELPHRIKRSLLRTR